MKKKTIIKKSFTIFILLLASSCSFLNPQSSNEFTVTKKSPLIMPPDMNMAPPEEKIRKKNYNLRKSNLEKKDEFSVEDILTGKTRVEKNINTENAKKIKYTRKNLVKKILRTKASKIIE